MSDSFLAQKLVQFANPEHEDPQCARPFVYYVNGQAWSVAMGGPWLYAVRGTSSHEVRTEADMARTALTAASSFVLDVSTAQLKAWAGKPPTVWDFPVDDRPEGVILDMVFDLSRLACLLDGIPFGRLTLWDSTAAIGVRSIILDARGKWRAVLAAVDGDPDEDHPVLNFAEAPTR